MDPPAAGAGANAGPTPQLPRRRGTRMVEWAIHFTISFVILSLLKLEPLARNSVQDHHKNEFDE